jgi:hypothetical protein
VAALAWWLVKSPITMTVGAFAWCLVLKFERGLLALTVIETPNRCGFRRSSSCRSRAGL